MSELWIDADGARLFSIDAGAGQAIVMLHGGMASHVAALPFVRGLADRHRTLVPDLRGSGKSWWGAADLSSLRMPALLVRGDDPLHPAEVSDVYATSIRDCAVLPASTVDVAQEIGLFVDRCASSGATAR